MSRIGKNPISIPAGVKVTVAPDTASADNIVTVTGPLGTLTRKVNKRLEIKIDNEKNNVLVINNHIADKNLKALHGLFRQLIANMVEGVSKGFEKKLNINGVGYKINLKSEKNAVLNIGFSHPVEVNAVNGITLAAEKNTLIIKGIDKELVGQFASNVRDLKPVEPYHAYGISYSDEVIIRKETKTGKK